MARNATHLEDDQEAKWIHRDKLTQIEIQEYVDRGMQPPVELLHRAARSGEALRSRQQAKYSEQISSNHNKRQRLQSPEPLPDLQTDDENDEPFVPEDPRSPEEIANEWHEEDVYNMSRLRTSSSKIPLASRSPMPIPLGRIEQDTPLRRPPGSSEECGDDFGGSQIRMRSRGNSIGSQVLLDDDDDFDISSPTKTKSPPKSRTPSNNNKITNGKTRTPSGQPRVVSLARPATRNGTGDRPRTAVNRPEGEPPWSDQIYKPDPMLPPDQQIIPTHAKRMRAEQLEREGKAGAIYDRELTPVQAYDDSKAQMYHQEEGQSPRGEIHQSQQPLQFFEQPYREEIHRPQQPLQSEPNRNTAWPLAPQASLDVPRSPNADHAGYTTMPSVRKVPSTGHLPSPRMEARPEQSSQLEPEKDDKKKEKGGCGCCVVM